jgi:hypothetical protein
MVSSQRLFGGAPVTSTDRFEALVESGKLTVRRLASHDPGYEASLRTGTMPDTLTSLVQSAFAQIGGALDALAAETAHRCGLPQPTSGVRFALPRNGSDQDHRSILENSLPGLAGTFPKIATEMLQLLDVLDSDRWLAPLGNLVYDLEALQLRRAIGSVGFTSTAEGSLQMTLSGEDGGSIPMFAPILIDEAPGTGARGGSAFYLIVMPSGREVVSFLDRCVRGTEQIGVGFRRALDAHER